MKRMCNEAEKKILYDNKNMVLKGIYKASVKGGYSWIFVGLFFTMVFFISGVYFFAEDEEMLKSGGDMIWLIWTLLSFTVPQIVVRVVMSKLKIRKSASTFFKADRLMINGATIVEINPIRGTFSYMEDDFLDSTGRPFVIDYPTSEAELKKLAVGMRMIVIYDSDTSFQIMQSNEQLKSLISQIDNRYPLLNPIYEYRRIPHPNASTIAPEVRTLNENESRHLTAAYIGKMEKGRTKVLAICSIIIFLCVMTASLILGAVKGNMAAGVLVGLAIIFIIGLLLAGLRAIGKSSMKKLTDLQYIQEALFHSNVVDVSGKYTQTYLKIYEWKDGRYQIITYPNVDMPKTTKYGEVIYKLTNKKGTNVFMSRVDVQKSDKGVIKTTETSGASIR